MKIKSIVFSLIIISSFLIFFPSDICKASGNNLYVGGSGSGNYSSIQAAIEDASPGDIIFIYIGTYHENVEIDKSIELRGEEKNLTIIDGGNNDHTIAIYADNVKINGFTIQNGYFYGISIDSFNYSIISNNKILKNYDGINLRYSNNNIISNNIILDNQWSSIKVYKSKNNEIKDNVFSNNSQGLGIYSSNNTIVTGNSFLKDGISVGWSYNSTVLNNFVDSKPIIYLERESNEIIQGQIGQVILVNCDNITIQNTKISNTTIGIDLWNTTNCLITGNIIKFNSYAGIYQYYSDNNTISNNIISDINDFAEGIAGQGLHLSLSTNNYLFNNSISKSKYGVYSWSGNKNNILENDIYDNHHGLYLQDCQYNIIRGNSINSNSLYGIFFYSSENNTIFKNGINYSKNGIEIRWKSNSNNVSENIFKENDIGICVSDNTSINNIFSGNIFLNNNENIFFNQNDLEKDKTENKKDKGIPGFELLIILVALAFIIYFNRRKIT